MRKLQTDYIDLLLIHQAFGDYYGTWRAMEEAYKAGKLRAIGVSNFYPDRFLDLATFSEIKPMVNQLETHVFQQHRADRKYTEQFGAKLEAWAPFAQGANNLFANPVLCAVGENHGKTARQVALRFLIQSGIPVILKSTHRERMAENFDIFGFALTSAEIAQIEALDGGRNLLMDNADAEQIAGFFDRFRVK